MDFNAEVGGFVPLTMDAADSDEDVAIIGKADVSNYNPDHILPEQPKVLHKIREWLDPTPYLHEGGEYRRHLASHVEGTGRWLTATETYQKWHSGPDHGLLWIKGIPGSGKSVFAATLAHVLATEGHPVLFFFFRQIIDANHQPVHMLRDWLDQVLEYSPPLQRDLKVYIDEDRRHLNRELESLGIDQLWKHLKTALVHLPRVYLVADALDEIDRGNDECLKALARLGLWRPGQVKVLITSRPVATVEAPLREFPALRIRLEEQLVDSDIATFVQHRLAGSAIPTKDHDLIKEAVPGRTNGLFLYAKLAMDAFLKPSTDVRQVLDNLPTDLNAIYANLLAEHARTSGISNDIQRLLLCWVTHATRPLRLLEMAEMLRATYTASGNHHDLKGAKALIRVACGPLLEIHPDETVSVVHHSLTEFLLGSTRAAPETPEDIIGSSFPILMPGPTHEQLALSCIRYLQSSGCLDTGTLSDGSAQDEEDWRWSEKERNRQSAIRLEFPFAGYACQNWAIHAAKSFTTGQASATLISALDSVLAPSPRLEAWLRMVSWPHAKQNVSARDIAASYGLTPYLEHLITREGAAAITCADVNGETPLFHSAKAGHTAVVKLLLAVGADPNPEDRSGHKPLHLAAKNNHAGVVTALLAAGVSPMTEKTRENPRTRFPLSGGPRTKGSTALMYACQAGHVAAVEAFLPWLHDIRAVHQALDWASREGQAQVVKRLIQHPGVDVNATVRGVTPLFNACLKNDVESIEALVLAGAVANVVCRGEPDEFSGGEGYDQAHRGRGAVSPLEAFCIAQKHRDEEAVEDAGSLERGLQLLLRAGADIHRRDGFSQTPLHHAAHQPALLHLLLRAGADPNVDSEFGGTLLHTQLSREGGWEVVKLLVEKGKADINMRRLRDGKTPLMAMIDEEGDLDVGVRFIHAFGPDCTIADNVGNCPLHAAAQRGHELGESRASRWDKLVDALLAAGARVDQRNHKGETATHLAESASVIERLVSSGADIEARDSRGATVLMRIVGLNRFDTWRQIDHLLSIGARMDTRDLRGRTLVHEMVSCLSHDGSHHGYGPGDVERLLGLGLDPYQVDYDGNTVLHALVGAPGAPVLDDSRRLRMFSYLVRQGVDPDAVNHRGQTVLHILSAKSERVAPAFIGAAIAVCEKETIDIPDCKGRRPIHFAVSVSESTVARLMRAGCDISARTNEGLTPLHLAASSQQSNILGLLLVEMKTAARYRHSARDIMNSPDNGGRTPLYYACLSGRPESVALLLNAGAEVKPWSQSLLTACSWFNGAREVPKVRRPGRVVEQNGSPETFNGAADTTLRHFHTRLDEIMGLLAKHGIAYSDTNQYGRPHIEAASNPEHIASCFSKLRAELGAAVDPETEEGANSPVQRFARRCVEIRRESATRAFQEMDLASLAKGDGNLQETLFVQLLERREFDLVEAAVRTWGWSPCLPNRHGWTLLHALVGLGHASLMARIATPEDVGRIDDAEWRKEQMRIADIQGNDRRRAPIPPLVLAACERKIPNMLILRFLVEDVKASVNASRVVDVDGHPDRVAVGESPLHVLAKGDQWWHAYEALPYLLLHRPDLEARDPQGNTPLHKALSNMEAHRPFFHNDRLFQKHAATLLVAAGADVNAATMNGRTCLSDAVATCDIELVQLLISHGARVTGRDVLAAIESLHRPTLEMLLSTPKMPSEETEVSPPEQVPEHIRDYGPRALYHAAAAMHNEEPGWGDQLDREEQTQKSRQARASMLRTLLAHGADPLGTVRLPKYPRAWVRTRYNSDEEGPLRDESSTVLHQVLLSNGMVEPFLELPTLDLEQRNEAGQTILLAACHNASTFSSTVSLLSPANTAPEPLITHLLRRGADPSAVDNGGLTALHTAVTNPVYFSSSEEKEAFVAQLQSLLLIPALRAAINTPDKAGNNPLHHALQADHGDATITVLLSAGADPRSVNPVTGDNALHLLARWLGSRGANVPVAMFERFAKLGADVNLRNAQGETPIFGAVAKADLQIRHGPPDPYGDDDGLDGERAEAMWQMFEEIGVDFAARDDAGRSLLHVAAERVETVWDDQTVGVYEKLLKMGVDPLVLDDMGRTSVDVAAACQNEAALALFEREDGRRRSDGQE